MQKGLYEYSRARAGHYSKVLFREPSFQAAVEVSRWRAYPLGLAIVAEAVAGVLRAAGGERGAVVQALSDRCSRCSTGIRCPTRSAATNGATCVPSFRAGSN